MVYQPKNPIGYRTLLTWKQSGEIHRRAKEFTRNYLDKVADSRLIAHINDSARSVQRNIEEGYKRATTKEYVEFLGFSRGSLEELKGDFEELKREWREGIRWVNKGEIRETAARSEAEGREIRERVVRVKVDGKDIKGTIARSGVIAEIEGLLDLIYGEDCMIGRQITSLEEKMVEEKTLPRGEMIRRFWGKAGSSDKRFWGLVEERFRLKKCEKGIVRRVNKGKEGEEKGEFKGSENSERSEAESRSG